MITERDHLILVFHVLCRSFFTPFAFQIFFFSFVCFIVLFFTFHLPKPCYLARDDGLAFRKYHPHFVIFFIFFRFSFSNMMQAANTAGFMRLDSGQVIEI